MPGGAAAKAKAKQAAEKAAEDMRQEYSTWHSKADRTEDTGVMRLLVVSMVLEAEQQTAHAVPVKPDQAPDDPITTSTFLKPSADGYDNVQSYMIEENLPNYAPWRGPNGWDVQVLLTSEREGQADYEDALMTVKKAFFQIWEQLDLKIRHKSGRTDLFRVRDTDAGTMKVLDPETEEPEEKDCKWVRVENALAYEHGAWFKGPKLIFMALDLDEEGNQREKPSDFDHWQETPIWDYEALMKKMFLLVYNDVEDHITAPAIDEEGDSRRRQDPSVKAQDPDKPLHEKLDIPMLIPPWKIEGDYAELERWMYEGIGTTTYWSTAEEEKKGGVKGQKVPVFEEWSMEDQTGTLGLTDRERISLRQAFQLYMKENSGGEEKLSQVEDILKKKVYSIVEFGPYHSPPHSILQWRVRSLKKQLQNKCVFWSNTEDSLPGGSVAENTITPINPNEADDDAPIPWSEARPTRGQPPACGTYQDEDDDAVGGEPAGWGNQMFEFWKYGKKIGTIRKKYVVEDRQRLLDTIESFTPTYKGVMKNMGMYEPSEDVDHKASERTMQIIANVSALALDLTLPEMQEDRVACYIKTRLEQVMGPTWHVAVGRSFGFCLTVEARHFVQMRMRHLEIVVWKSEPDKSSGKKKDVEG